MRKTQRRNRIKALPAVLTSENLACLMYSPLGGTLEKPFTKQLFLMNSYVAGTNHVRYFRKYVGELKSGERVCLVREPDNPEDKFAILVINQKGHKIGYIPRRKNKMMARMLDAGKAIYGVADTIVKPEKRYQMNWYVKVNVYMED